MRIPYGKHFGVLVLLAMLLTNSVEAQFQQPQPEAKELSPVSRTYAITNATIFQAPGRKIDRGTVVLRDGLITSVGKNVSIPADAIIIKGDSLHIYAGFIDGLSHVGVSKPKEDSNRERPKDPGNPAPEIAGITPYEDVRTSLNPKDKSVEDLRAVGFTVAQVVPYGRMLPGSGAIISLSGKKADEMILVGKSAFYSELAPAPRIYPSTVIGVMAKWRELYRQAVLAKNYEAMYASNRAGLNRPASDRILEAFYPVIDKKLPVLFEGDKYLDIQRILALQADFGFPLMIGDIKEGWDAMDKLKASGTKVFLSLDLPEDKKSDKKDDKGGKKEEPKKDEKASKPDPEKEALEQRKAESVKQHVGQASTFKKAGFVFGFSTLTAKPSDIQGNLRKIITSGLSEDDALAALTTSPAQLLGLSDRLGSVDQGKIANLVISDKPYFHEKAKVRYVFVDGVMYKYDPKEQPKAESGAINIAGTWTVTTQTGTQKIEEKVTFTKEGNTYAGSVIGANIAQALNLENITLTGNKLKYSYTTQAEGQSQKVDVDVTIEGDTFKGTSSAGTGSFSIEGKKDPKR